MSYIPYYKVPVKDIYVGCRAHELVNRECGGSDLEAVETYEDGEEVWVLSVRGTVLGRDEAIAVFTEADDPEVEPPPGKKRRLLFAMRATFHALKRIGLLEERAPISTKNVRHAGPCVIRSGEVQGSQRALSFMQRGMYFFPEIGITRLVEWRKRLAARPNYRTAGRGGSKKRPREGAEDQEVEGAGAGGAGGHLGGAAVAPASAAAAKMIAAAATAAAAAASRLQPRPPPLLPVLSSSLFYAPAGAYQAGARMPPLAGPPPLFRRPAILRETKRARPSSADGLEAMVLAAAAARAADEAAAAAKK